MSNPSREPSPSGSTPSSYHTAITTGTVHTDASPISLLQEQIKHSKNSIRFTQGQLKGLKREANDKKVDPKALRRIESEIQSLETKLKVRRAQLDKYVAKLAALNVAKVAALIGTPTPAGNVADGQPTTPKNTLRPLGLHSGSGTSHPSSPLNSSPSQRTVSSATFGRSQFPVTSSPETTHSAGSTNDQPLQLDGYLKACVDYMSKGQGTTPTTPTKPDADACSEGRPMECDSDPAPASPTATNAKSVKPQDHRPVHHGEHCDLSRDECHWRSVQEFNDAYREPFRDFCRLLCRGRETCLTGTAMANPLMPLSFGIQERRRWEEVGTLPPRFRVPVGCGDRRHRHTMDINAVLRMDSYDTFMMYRRGRIQCSHLCHRRECIHYRHVILEPAADINSREACALTTRQARQDNIQARLDEWCEAHDPPCLLQMAVDDMHTSSIREFALLNKVQVEKDTTIFKNLQPPGSEWPLITASQRGSWFRTIGDAEQLDQSGINTTQWVNRVCIQDSSQVRIKGYLDGATEKRLLEINQPPRRVDVLLRSLKSYDEAKSPCADEKKDLSGKQHMNALAQFAPASGESYQCMFCTGHRAWMSPVSTEVWPKGFEHLQTALLHSLEDHREYSLEVKLSLLVKEYDVSAGVQAAYVEALGAGAVLTGVLADMQGGILPDEVRRIMDGDDSHRDSRPSEQPSSPPSA
ncbi:hypothetical protein GGR56DRAFT_654228 [Xylariaceae sp. FL0804]|nr:hypothetical protein GGR56DRAFT_654228 [Xylariaceae sp. FL0804]